MHDILEDWKQIGPAGKDHDNALWRELNGYRQAFFAARKAFFDRRKEEFEERDRERAENRSAKEALVDRASRVSLSGEWKDGSEEMHNLLEEWKQIGPAGKDSDNALWRQLNGYRQAFFSARTAFFERRDRGRAESKSRKQNIIAEARSISFSPSNWHAVHEQLQDLKEEWKQAGRAGKDDDDTLWNEFSKIRERFYQNWDSYKKQERAAKGNAAYKFGESPEEKRSMKRTLRGFSNLSDGYNRFLDKLDKPMAPSDRKRDRQTYSAAMEIGRDKAGKIITKAEVGHQGYVHTTHNSEGYGKTTGHASGDLHHHGTHSKGPGTHHHTDGGSKPSGPNIGKIIK